MSLIDNLRDRLSQLASHLLPTTSDTLNYSPADYDRVRAYVVLVHAEIEEYVERRVEDEVRRRMIAWNKARSPSIVLMGLLAFRDGKWPNPIESIVAPNQGKGADGWHLRDIDFRLAKCESQIFANTRRNNGIAPRDLLRLLLALGFRVADFDATLLSELDNLGTQRGVFAHRTVQSVQQQPDPVSTRNRVNNILAGLETLDKALEALT